MTPRDGGPAACSAAAVLMARNAATTLGRVLDHMAANGVPVVMVDHGSTDATREIAAERRGRPVVELIDEPYAGVFDLTRQLALKREIIAGLDADWIVNLDADELLLPSDPGETLAGFLARQRDAPGAAVNCEEFTFLPRSEAERHGSRFVETMTGYVRFRTRDPKQRVFRRGVELDRWMATGGHFVTPDAIREPLQLHHYIGLSLDHLRAQYIGRVYSAPDLAKGWSSNRRSIGADFIVPPGPFALRDRRHDGLCSDRPVGRLPVFAPRSGSLPQASLPPGVDLVLACEDPEALVTAAAALAAVAPGLRIARLSAPVQGLPGDAAVLHVIADGRRRLRGAWAVAPRERAGAWCRFVAAFRQEGLRLARYAELRAEDLAAGEADLDAALDRLLGGAGERRRGFPAHRPWRQAPAGLAPEALRAFEALAGPLLRDLGYAVG